MSDIVERLRAEYREWGEAFHAEAADEIERLRKEIELLREVVRLYEMQLAVMR